MSDAVEISENTGHLPNQAQEATALPVSTGALLQAGRKQKNIEIDQVAQALKLSPRQILALETDDYQALPDPMITRGFIRNYARYLEIDAQPLLEFYRQTVPAVAPPSLALDSVNISFGNSEKRFLFKYIVLSLLILIAGGVWILYHDYWQSDVALGRQETMDAQSNKASVAPNADTQVPVADNVDLPEPALPIAERMASSESEAVAQAQNAAAGMQSSANAPVENAAKALAKPDNQPVSTAQARITLTFSEASWVSVRDAQDREVFNKTMPAGTTTEIVGIAPLTLIIGNSGGTQLVYAGKPIDLTPYTKLNVARLRLPDQSAPSSR